MQGLGHSHEKGDLDITLGTRQPGAQASSRMDGNVAWKGKLTLDHCGQLWDGRKEGPGLVTSREDQGASGGAKLQDPACPQGPCKHSHTASHWGLTQLGRGMITRAHFTNKETEAQEGKVTW